MTIDIEQLRKDMEAGTHGPNHSHLAGEYLALREAADALAEAVEYLRGASSLGDYDPPQVSMGRGIVTDALKSLAAYRKATG